MKNKVSFVIVYWWLFLLLLLGLGLAAFAPKEERISESENRTLSGFPEFSAESLFSGEFFQGIESYLSDGLYFSKRRLQSPIYFPAFSLLFLHTRYKRRCRALYQDIKSEKLRYAKY